MFGGIKTGDAVGAGDMLRANRIELVTSPPLGSNNKEKVP